MVQALINIIFFDPNRSDRNVTHVFSKTLFISSCVTIDQMWGDIFPTLPCQFKVDDIRQSFEDGFGRLVVTLDGSPFMETLSELETLAKEAGWKV